MVSNVSSSSSSELKLSVDSIEVRDKDFKSGEEVS